MTSTAHAVSTSDAPSTVATDTSVRSTKTPARRALRAGGWANLVIAAAHTIGLLWAWSMFRAIGIEPEMRELATQGAALPYVLTLVTAGAFLVFGLYALSGAGDLRRLPLLRTGLVVLAVIYLWRATWVIGAISDGDGAQVAFAAIALLVGLCYAAGAVRPGARERRRDGGVNG